MPEPTKNAQEAGKTTGATTGSTMGGSAGPGMTGYSAGQTQGGQTTSGSAARQARERSSASYGESGESPTMGRGMGEMMGQARHGLSETWEQAMDYSRDNPGKSTLIAFGVGVGVGMLMAGGFATRSRTRRIVPPVMNALSEIASELFR
jgi:ElaB/YqjD/DUF883 family membrane-anchored ribosome-binding protein